jgi:hypothetical protein
MPGSQGTIRNKTQDPDGQQHGYGQIPANCPQTPMGGTNAGAPALLLFVTVVLGQERGSSQEEVRCR